MEILQGIADYWHVFTSVLTAIGFVIVLWLTANFVRNKTFFEALEKMDRRLSAVEVDNGRIDQMLQKLPTADAVNDIKIALAQLNGRIEALQEQGRGQAEVLKIVKNQGDRVNAYLLEHGVK